MGLIFTNIFPYPPPISLKALNPKPLDLAVSHDWVEL